MIPNRKGTWEWNSKTFGKVIVDVFKHKTKGFVVFKNSSIFIKIEDIPNQWGKRIGDLDSREINDFDYD